MWSSLCSSLTTIWSAAAPCDVRSTNSFGDAMAHRELRRHNDVGSPERAQADVKESWPGSFP